ncbi:UNVERIFIED_CONTAM: hypothetical protein PYX00_010016 [Menopon gallinae]|uniref:Thyroglobulin type-1 domain-containing protein n=1 Tax=Menopon gallinae TaxID=328185 RepID=A0AAW2HDU1_9NEOP
MLLLVFFLILLIQSPAGEEITWLCTDKFCEKYPCPELPEQCEDRSRSVLIPSPQPCNCCDHCIIFQAENETCAKIATDLKLPDFMCGPGLFCNKERKCQKFPDNKKDPFFYPNYHCVGDDCYCSVIEDGREKRIFGQFKKDEIEKDKLQCECSLVAYKARKHRIQALPPEFNPATPRCLSNGQFDPLQCIGDKCGCVDEDTGSPDENGFDYNLEALGENHPPCFDKKRHIPGYYTDCERRRYKIIIDRNELFANDTTFMFTKPIACTPDGKYETQTQ